MDFDHSKVVDMEEIAISKFKATCLSVLEKVRRTRKPILVTRFGKAIAEVVPPPPKPRPEHWLGALESTGKIKEDIISPATDEKDWEVLRS
jgi:antitoxin (DNA-binding transcriptional repressor) of toxin-antitoxin stability system